MSYIPLTERAHQAISRILQPGDIGIDATMGNGRDTLFLAQAVGSAGHIYAFDIQNNALTLTHQRLTQSLLQSRVTLIKADHQTMTDYISDPVSAAMFNLGYLPGGNKAIMTLSASTLKALNACVQLLATPGCLTIMLYPGHLGGDHEAQAVKNWVNHLPNDHFKIETIIPYTRHNRAPELIIINQ